MSQHISSLIDLLYMNVSVPQNCKTFLQSRHANVNYVRAVMQAIKAQHTSQLSLGAILCQLCLMEFQLGVDEMLQPSSLYKQLVEASIFEQLLKVVFDVCWVSFHAS